MLYRDGMDPTVATLTRTEIAAAKELLRKAPFAYLALVEALEAGPEDPAPE